MSVGVNVLLRLASEAARLLGTDYDLEVVEAPSPAEGRCPSGTALRLAEVLAKATADQGTLAERVCYGRQGAPGPRPRTQIGIHAMRGGILWATTPFITAVLEK